jgi:hypothetical protein
MWNLGLGPHNSQKRDRIFVTVRMMLFQHVSCGIGKISSFQVIINCILSDTKLKMVNYRVTRTNYFFFDTYGLFLDSICISIAEFTVFSNMNLSNCCFVD